MTLNSKAELDTGRGDIFVFSLHILINMNEWIEAVPRLSEVKCNNESGNIKSVITITGPVCLSYRLNESVTFIEY